MSRRVLVLLIGLGVFVMLFAVIQLVPYRVTNPSPRNEPAWNRPETRRLAVAACYDCHSNETETAWWEDRRAAVVAGRDGEPPGLGAVPRRLVPRTGIRHTVGTSWITAKSITNAPDR